MRNLAGHPDATSEFARELRVCGIATTPSAEPDGETRAAVDGVADLGGGFALRVVRGWCYARVTVTPPLPMEVAVDVNAAPHADEGSRYSAANGRLGGVARAHGFAGGMDEAMLRRWRRALDHWHVDTVPALGALVRVLREMIARRAATADTARAEQVRIETEGWLAEAHLLRDGVVADIMRENLHTNRDIDGSDPRIIALRAEFPPEHATTPAPVCPAPTEVSRG